MRLLQRFLGYNARTALIRKNILSTFVIKGWSAVVTLALVPLTLHCLGEYSNGVWLTISSMLLWIDNLDVGLGNGLRNKLGTYLAQGETEKAREAVSSTVLMLVGIVVPFALVLLVLIEMGDVYSVLNADATLIPDLKQVIEVALIFVCATFILKFIGNFYMGLQLMAVNSLMVVSAHTLTLIATWILYVQGCHSILWIAVVNCATPLLVYLLAYPYTFYVRYPELRPSIHCFNRVMVQEVFSIGIKFFVLQISSIILFFSSNLILSKFCSPAAVTPYQIAYKYFSLVLVGFTAISNPYWSATTDAYARGDYQWIEHSHRSLRRVILGLTGVLVVLLLISPMVYQHWIGDDVLIPWSLSAGMTLYILILITSLAYSNFLNGMGILRMQIYCTVGAAVLFIPLSWLVLSHRPEASSILLVMALTNLPGMVVNILQFNKIMRQKLHL